MRSCRTSAVLAGQITVLGFWVYRDYGKDNGNDYSGDNGKENVKDASGLYRV